MYEGVPYSAGSEEVWAAMSAYFACLVFFAVLIVAFQIWLFWRILTKAGLNGWLSLLSLIGGIGTFAILLILALSEWPALRGPGSQGHAAPPGSYMPTEPTSGTAGSFYPPPPPA